MRSLALLSLLTALMFSAGTWAQSQSTLLDQGIYAEDSLGDLDKAIELYEQILADAEANRVYAAQAQYRVGVCNAKKGLEKDAAAAFRKVVNRYPGQPTLVTQARARLTKLGLGTNGENLAMTTRQVWVAPTGTRGGPSPNGRYFSYENRDTGNLAVRDLETGENRDVTHNGTADVRIQRAGFSIWSPDSTQILYQWTSWGEKTEDNWHELRIVGLDGSEPRVLNRLLPDQWGLNGRSRLNPFRPRDWSHDGKYILGRLRGTEDDSLERGYEDHIALVSVVDGSERILKSLGKRWAPRSISMSFSPDDRYVVFELRHEDDSEKRNICIIATDASPEEDWVEIEHPDDAWAPFWTPDGNSIVFTSDRSGSNALWMLDIEEGKPKGDPTLIKGVEKSFHPKGITQDGSLYYTIYVAFNRNIRPANNFYVATIDLETGKTLEPPKKVSLLSDSNNAARWSRDGKYLAYASNRSPQDMTHLIIWSVQTGEEREIKLNTQREIVLCDWSPDGRSILYKELFFRNGEKSIALHLLDVQTGDFTTITECLRSERSFWFPRRFLKNGKEIYYLRGQSILMTYNLETHVEQELYRSKTTILRGSWPSPDGRRLAILESQTSAAEQPAVVRTISTSNGQPGKSLYAATLNWGGLRWTADGEIMAVIRTSDGDMVDKLLIIPVEGGEARELELELKLPTINLNPDGRRIAIERRGRASETQIWVLENFLPKSTASE